MKFKQSDTKVPRNFRSVLISRCVLLTSAVVAALFTNQVPGLCSPDETQKPAQPQQLPQSAQPTQSSQVSGKKPSQADILIVQLSATADRDKFDDLLQEVHGTL